VTGPFGGIVMIVVGLIMVAGTRKRLRRWHKHKRTEDDRSGFLTWMIHQERSSQIIGWPLILAGLGVFLVRVIG
jgi:hypothetical protein